MIQNIVFYYPSKIIGGAELLFIRNAIKLSIDTEYPIYYVDYSDGISVGLLQKSSVKLIEYKGCKTVIPSKSLLVAQLNQISNYDSLLKKSDNVRFLFWSLHPLNLKIHVYWHGKCLISDIARKRIGSILSRLNDLGVVQFMDYANYKTNDDLFSIGKDNISYLPVPVDDDCFVENPRKGLLSEDEIHFAWIGRICDTKYKTILTLMNEIEAYCSTKTKILHIVGNGAYLDVIKKYASKMTYEIIFEGTIFPDKLGDFIFTKTDIGLAMGTSNLEFGCRGVPAILKGRVDNIRNAGYSKDYIFTNEIKGYSLGASENFSMPNQDERTFKEKVDLILNNYSNIAKKCYDYTKENHSLKYTSNLIAHIAESADNKENDEIEFLLKNIQDSINNGFPQKFHRLIIILYRIKQKIAYLWQK